MSAPEVLWSPHEAQTLVVQGYTYDYCCYFILTVAKRAAAKSFFAKLLAGDWIEPSGHERRCQQKDATPVSVAFTYAGLEALGLRPPYLNVLQRQAKAYHQGPHCRAASRLADTGASAPRYWDQRFDRDTAHVMLALHGDDQASMRRARIRLMRLARRAFLVNGWKQPLSSAHLQPRTQAKRRKVHFGFFDGISRVLFHGLEAHKGLDLSGNSYHAPGEFLLGYPNDEGYNPWLLADEPVDPCVPAHQHGEELRPAVLSPGDFFRNGSFAALRDIAQDEVQFKKYIDLWADRLRVSQEYVRAKMLGRWDNGAVVKATHKQAPPNVDENTLDHFDFRDDPLGHGCPFGSHVRRMNPRGDAVVPFRRRPLIRRGMPYGPVWNGEETDKTPRGLMGLFICASLEEQFEHLIAEWGDANPMGTSNKGDAKDPLIGNHENAGAMFDIPMKSDTPRTLEELQPFVTTRGTLYLFFPGLKVLRNLDNTNVFLV